MFCWWFILNTSTFYEFVLIFLFPGMDLSNDVIFFLMCTIVFFIYMLNSKDDKNSKRTLMIDRCNIRRRYNGLKKNKTIISPTCPLKSIFYAITRMFGTNYFSSA